MHWAPTSRGNLQNLRLLSFVPFTGAHAPLNATTATTAGVFIGLTGDQPTVRVMVDSRPSTFAEARRLSPDQDTFDSWARRCLAQIACQAKRAARTLDTQKTSTRKLDPPSSVLANVREVVDVFVLGNHRPRWLQDQGKST